MPAHTNHSHGSQDQDFSPLYSKPQVMSVLYVEASPCLRIDSHHALSRALRNRPVAAAVQAGGLLGQAAQAVQPRSQMQYNFYSRSCCLMYR